MGISDLIDRGALVTEMDKFVRLNKIDPRCSELSANSIYDLINSMPTIDAVQVVRCCDCFYSAPNVKQSDYLDPPSCDGMYCFRISQDVDFTDFCSQGKTRNSMDADAPERGREDSHG